jgi:nucleotide-binding universal stress UspA family protein
MKSILVPTDFSDHALYALKVAASIARKINARIMLAHVYNMPSAGYSHIAYYDKFCSEMRENAEKQLDSLAASTTLKNISISKHLLTDRHMWELVTDEEFRNVSLTVIGAHGTSGFNKVFIGSNTEKIVRLADVPVLTIKDEIKSFRLKKIVFASDFEEESYRAFRKIKYFIRVYQPELYLLKVITPSHFESTQVSEKKIHSFSRMFSLKNHSVNIINYPGIEPGIIDFSHRVNSDLIIIPTHGRTGFAHLINGSLAESLVRHEPMPILSIKIPEQPETPVTKLRETIEYESWGHE